MNKECNLEYEAHEYIMNTIYDLSSIDPVSPNPKKQMNFPVSFIKLYHTIRPDIDNDLHLLSPYHYILQNKDKILEEMKECSYNKFRKEFTTEENINFALDNFYKVAILEELEKIEEMNLEDMRDYFEMDSIFDKDVYFHKPYNKDAIEEFINEIDKELTIEKSLDDKIQDAENKMDKSMKNTDTKELER